MKKILFIGAGNMGGAILSAVISQKILPAEKIFVRDKSGKKAKFFAEKYGAKIENPKNPDAIFLAVKPQIFPEILPIQNAKNALLISVMAGISTAEIAEKTGAQKICRAMPNTPALVGAGATGIFFTDETPEKDRDFCRNLFGGIGAVFEIADEDQMHAITALSGSGPAYFFQFVENLAAAGQKLGLSAEISQKLAAETFFGAAKLLEKSGDTPENLRKKVTSPGGTTAAALENFKTNDFQKIIESALFAAATRSRELGKKNLPK